MNCPWFRATTPFAASLGLAAALLTPSTAAQSEGSTTLDLAPVSFHITQSIQSGTTTLTGGRSTMVRVPILASGTIPPGTVVDGTMRVYDQGVEIPGSPFYSDNGPIPATASPGIGTINGTLNFIVVPPTSGSVRFVIDVNPAGPNQVEETDYTNNSSASPPTNFQCRDNPEVVFVPVDHQYPTVGVVNLPQFDLIKAGVGDGFFHAIFPAPDAHYHRSVAPKKIWTTSLSSASSGNQLNSALAADMQLMVPVPDFIYGWAPGALPGYNGVAISVPGVAAMGNSEEIRHQRTMAHELGHLFGLSHNFSTADIVGIDVEHHLNLTQGLDVIKPVSQKDIMYAGLLTHEAWVREGSHNTFFNNASMQCTSPASDATPPTRLYLGGMHDMDAKSIDLMSTFTVVGGRDTYYVPVEDATLILHVFEGDTLVAELGLNTKSSADSCPACRGDHEEGEEHGDHDQGATDDPTAPAPLGAFGALLPAGLDPAQITRVAFVDAETGATIDALDRTEHAPTVEFGAITHGPDGEAIVTWKANDADGDAMTFYLRYSHDGARVAPLATALETPRAVIDAAALPKMQHGSGYLEILASDGLHTTSVRHYPDETASADLGPDGGAAPHCLIYSPDDGKSYPLGANVVLHAHAWDIEDGRLDDGDVVWSSNVEGPLGTGRLFTTADLSVGVHTITVTATDSGGGISSASSDITITDRDLPGLGNCQVDLGFGGPGSSELTVCGGDLSTGTTADVSLTGAAPSQAMWLAVGTVNNPTPVFGGLLVPFPTTTVLPDVTDSNGDWFAPAGLIGGGGPLTIYLQAAYVDGSQPSGFGISNAVQVELLP